MKHDQSSPIPKQMTLMIWLFSVIRKLQHDQCSSITGRIFFFFFVCALNLENQLVWREIPGLELGTTGVAQIPKE